MRKDWLAADRAVTDEDFVSDFWDECWSHDERDEVALREALRTSEEYAFLDAVVPELQGRRLDVLDCGCGRGQWTLLLREEGHQAVGVDIARSTLSALVERYGEVFRHGDFRRLESADACFDLLLNWGGIEHSEEGPQPALPEAWRVLRPGGRLVVTTPCHNLRVRLRDALLGYSSDSPGRGLRFYQYRFRPRELEAAFRTAGFVDIRSRTIGGAQGMARSLQLELAFLRRRLPRSLLMVVERAGARLLRRFLGHMVICTGAKPAV